MEIAKMSAAQLKKAMDSASLESSKIVDLLIDAGRGNERPNDMMSKSDPLSLKYQKNSSLLQSLYAEKNRRQIYHGSLRPIKYQENPTMATKKFSPAQIAAQKLFAERARAGTLNQRKKRKPNPGLYENIDAKRKRIAAGSGEKMRKPGQAGRPTAKAFEQSAMTAKRNPDSMSVANTILAQLGGNRFTAMTGAKNFIGGSMFLGFEIGKNSSPANRVTITYSQARDLYSMTFLKAKRGGLDTVELKRFDNVYADQLRSVFTEYTGLETSLGTMGRKTNPDKSKPRAYVMRASQATGRPPVKGTKAGNRLITRRKKALSAPAGYFPNPSTNRGLAIFLDAIALGETFSESKLIEALDHPSLSVSDRNVIRDALKGRPYSHIRLMDAAMKIRNYKGERKTNPAAAMMTGYQVICMHPKKHVVGIFKTMAEAKMVATAMANAKGVAYGVKAVKVHKTHFAV